MILIFCVLFSIMGSFWRAWFGGSFDGNLDISRIWKILVLLLIFILMLLSKNSFLFYKDYNFYLSFLLFMRFWNHSHGDYFKVNDASKDEARVWFVDKILQLIYGKDNYYNFWGNVTGMFMGYSIYSILTCFFLNNYLFSFAGLIVAFSYGICGKLFPDKCYTKYAEFLSGFLSFLLIYLCL